MKLFKIFTAILFLPGTIVLKRLGVSVEEDGGILRSFINASFWGMICLMIALKYFA
jgi:hypothetical protein